MNSPLSSANSDFTNKLWSLESSAEIRSLIQNFSDRDLECLAGAIRFRDYPLNALAGPESLDRRSVLSSEFALQLLKAHKTHWATMLIGQLVAKLHIKIAKGSCPSGGVPEEYETAFLESNAAGAFQTSREILNRFQNRDFWRIDRMLKPVLVDIAMEMLRMGRSGEAAVLLESVLLDYPEDLENRFWYAAACHNCFLEDRSRDELKEKARAEIAEFVRRAQDQPDFSEKRENLKNLLTAHYS
jgi:hypothetical protein